MKYRIVYRRSISEDVLVTKLRGTTQIDSLSFLDDEFIGSRTSAFLESKSDGKGFKTIGPIFYDRGSDRAMILTPSQFLVFDRTVLKELLERQLSWRNILEETLQTTDY